MGWWRRRESGNDELLSRAAAVMDEAYRLWSAGCRAKAVQTGERGLAMVREVAERDRQLALPVLVLATSNHAGFLSDAGRRRDAVRVAEEAVDRGHELYAIDRGRGGVLARVLSMAANRLIEAGRPQQALAYSREAMELIDVRADAILANQLNTLGRSLAATGQPAEALQVTERALAMWGELAAEQPPGSPAHLEYGGTLHNLANRLFAVGRWEDAVRTSAEVVAWYREPAGEDRAGWQDRLAQALGNYALFLGNVRQSDAALQAAEEAVTISRELAGAHPAFRGRLAWALKEYGDRLFVLVRPAEGRAALVESVNLYRELAGADRGGYLSWFAQAVNDLAALSQVDDGLALAEEAVALRRELVAANRSYELPGLALSLSNLAGKQAAADRFDVAVATGEEALELIARPSRPTAPP